MKLVILASDGSIHSYPKGCYPTIHGEGGWISIKDETGQNLGIFFRPRYVIWRDEV